MDIKFLGTGGVFDYELGNSAALVSCNSTTFLVDCGPLVYPLLARRHLVGSVDFVLLTHLHGDHVGGLFQFILHTNSQLQENHKTVIAFPTVGFKAEIESFLRIWFPILEKYVEFCPLEQLAGVGALDTTGTHIPGITTFAYYFFEESSLIYFSGDTGDPSIAANFVAGRHEQRIVIYHEMHHLKGSAHTYYLDLMDTLGDRVVYGYHCNGGKIPPENTIPLVERRPELLI